MQSHMGSRALPRGYLARLTSLQLQGRLILEVPVQNNPISQITIDAADNAGVLIRDIDGRIY